MSSYVNYVPMETENENEDDKSNYQEDARTRDLNPILDDEIYSNSIDSGYYPQYMFYQKLLFNEDKKPENPSTKKESIFKILKFENEKNKKKININVQNEHMDITPDIKFLIFEKAKTDNTSLFLSRPIFSQWVPGKGIIKTRKYTNDDIFKKIRGKFFHEIVIGKLNRILEKMNIQMKFEFADISQNSNIKDNIKYLNSTLKEVLKTVKFNQTVLDEIEKLGDDAEEIKPILNAKIRYLYKEYFDSEEYQKSIGEMLEINENYDYIYLYIKKSKDFFNYYSKENSKKNKYKKKGQK